MRRSTNNSSIPYIGFALLLLLVPHYVNAQDVDPMTISAARYDVKGSDLAIFEDRQATMSFAEAEAAYTAGRFDVLEQPRLNRGTTASAFWLRLEVENRFSSAQKALLSMNYAELDDVQLYTRDRLGNVLQVARGDSVEQAIGLSRSRLPVFPLALGPQSKQPVYIRVATTSNMNLKLTLWSPDQFQTNEFFLIMVYGLLFGGIATTVLYLLFAARLTRESNTLLLAAYLSSYAVYLCFLNGFPLLWLPTALSPYVNTLHTISLGLLFGLGALFYRRFLQLATFAPRFNRFVAMLQWMGFMIVLAPLLPAPLISVLSLVVAGPGPLLTSAYAFYLWHQHRRSAAVFAIGWFIAHFASFLGTLRVAGVLPNYDVLLHLPAAGCAIACIFFTWAVARRLAQEQKYAYTDYLTGLANRRSFFNQGHIEFDRAKRYQRPLSVLMVDVDHFKKFNDTWGHAFGDKVLQNVAKQSLALSRESDIVARIGGEEFTHLLIETDLEDAGTIAQRLLLAQSKAAVDGQSITVSIGVVKLLESDEDFESLLNRA
ncbi:MAG: sensor domain-containing diguanylate cyclase, partial [Halioglobus sp.]|nr:sensor domain-containing diguanylate cyclase [Halioglobus sp.]